MEVAWPSGLKGLDGIVCFRSKPCKLPPPSLLHQRWRGSPNDVIYYNNIVVFSEIMRTYILACKIKQWLFKILWLLLLDSDHLLCNILYKVFFLMQL